MATTDIEAYCQDGDGLSAGRGELGATTFTPSPFAPFVPAACPHCGERFMKFLLDGHIRRCADASSKIGFARCKACGRPIKAGNMDRHMRNAHR